jgi:hypothetical protein
MAVTACAAGWAVSTQQQQQQQVVLHSSHWISL